MKYLFNENYFEKVNTEEKAYWLGFVAADGCVELPDGKERRSYKLTINLKSTDGNHLEKFQKCLGRNAPLYRCTSNYNTGVCRLIIGSKQMIGDLIRHGIMPNKSHIIKCWNGDENLLRHYWRGIFDGDGSISRVMVKPKKYKPYPAWKVALNGNRNIVEGFRNFVLSNGANSEGNLAPHYSIYKLAWGGVRPAKEVIGILYEGAEIYLDRKMSLAKELMDYETRRIKNKP